MNQASRIAAVLAEWADAGDDVPEELKLIRELRGERDELAACLTLYVAKYPAFRCKPVGSPNSEVREEHDRRILMEDRASSALATQGRQP